VAKRIRNYSGIIARVLFKNNYLEFTRFSCSITVKFIRNNASNIASKNCAKRLRYSNRAVTTIREVALTALLVYLDLHALIALCLQVVIIAAEDGH